MERDKRPSESELLELPLSQLRSERASLPIDNDFSQVVDRELRDMYSDAIRAKTGEGVPSL